MERRIVQWGAVCLTAGVVLFGAASLLHPPTVSPWDPSEALAEAALHIWLIDHTVLLIGIVALHLGLFILHTRITDSQRPQLSHAALACGITSLTLWVALFVFELTGWRLLALAAAPQLGSAAQMPTRLTATSGPEGMLAVAAQSLWSTTISLGYAAAFLLGLALFFWSFELSLGNQFPRWLARFGIVVGLLTMVALPIAFRLLRIALWLLILAAGLMGAWLLAAAWSMWRDPGESRM